MYPRLNSGGTVLCIDSGTLHNLGKLGISFALLCIAVVQEKLGLILCSVHKKRGSRNGTDLNIGIAQSVTKALNGILIFDK